MRRKFNPFAAAVAILTWLVIRTVAREIGILPLVAGVGGVIIGVFLYYIIDDHQHSGD